MLLFFLFLFLAVVGFFLGKWLVNKLVSLITGRKEGPVHDKAFWFFCGFYVVFCIFLFFPFFIWVTSIHLVFTALNRKVQALRRISFLF